MRVESLRRLGNPEQKGGNGGFETNMELMQLRMLVAVAEEGTLQSAAERVFRTGPAVSMAIRKLEEELGTPLFDRSKGHDFRLANAGEVLVVYAKRLLALRDEAVAAVEGIRTVKRGQLCIGANQSIGEHLLPTLTKAFQNHYPGVKLKVVIGYSDAVLSALKRYKLDVALVASQPRDEGLRKHLFMRDRLVAVMSPRHPLANRDTIHVQDLGSESLILLTELSELRERVVRTFRRCCVSLNVEVETETLQSIKKMAAGEMGVGIVPRMCVQEEQRTGELVVKPIEEFREERSLWVVCRNTSVLPPASQAFLKVLKSELSRPIADSDQGSR
jgi:DNA-binding transcriptional LysR family regulator